MTSSPVILHLSSRGTMGDHDRSPDATDPGPFLQDPRPWGATFDPVGLWDPSRILRVPRYRTLDGLDPGGHETGPDPDLVQIGLPTVRWNVKGCRRGFKGSLSGADRVGGVEVMFLPRDPTTPGLVSRLVSDDGPEDLEDHTRTRVPDRGSQPSTVDHSLQTRVGVLRRGRGS